MANDVMDAFGELNKFLSVCPNCGDPFYLSEARPYLSGKKPRSVLERLRAENPFKETESKIRIEIDTTEPVLDVPELVSEVLAEAAHGLNDARKDHMLTGLVDVAEDAGMTVGPVEVSDEYEYTRPGWDDPFKLKYTVEITL